MIKPQVTSYASDIAANQAGASDGPAVLQKSPYLESLHLKWKTFLTESTRKRRMDALDSVYTLCQALSNQTMKCIETDNSFLTLGGDHSCGIGTWSGAARALKGRLGLIWIDAHMDAHTPDTSETKNIHGMPVATLLGQGDSKLLSIAKNKPVLLPEDLVLVGIRSFEAAEAALLEQLKVRVYFIEEVEERGLATIMREAVHRVTKKTAGFGVSIDIDAIDPEEAPGVSTPEKGGLSFHALIQSLDSIAKHPKLLGAEIAEFNPKNDIDHRTEQVIAQLIQVLFQ